MYATLVKFRRKSTLILAFAPLMSLPAMHAHAVLSDNITIGNAKALALGHAVTADPPGIDSVHYNPAGLSRIKGTQSELKVIAGDFAIELVFGDGYTDSWTKKTQVGEGAPEGFTYDESKGQTSQSQGAALMLPFAGLTDLPVMLAPLGGISYSPPDSDLTFATNVYSPMMVGFSRADDDPGRFMLERLSFTLISYFAPSVSYQVTDTLSIGGAITFNYAGVGLDLPFREPNLALVWLEDLREGKCHEEESSVSDGFTEISDFLPCIPANEAVKLYDTLGYLSLEVEKSLTFGMNVGALWDATPWLTFGVVYQSPIEMDMDGDFSWTQGESLLNLFQELNDELGGALTTAPFGLSALVTPKTKGSANVNMTFPDHLAFGTSVQVTPRTKVNIDYKFTRWSNWESIPVKLSDPIGVIVIASAIQPEAAPPPPGRAVSFPLGLEDTWNVALGVEYQLTDRVALRFGVEDRPASIPKESRSPLLPIGSGTLYAVGAAYEPSATQTMNFAIANFHSSTFMPGNTSKLGNSEDLSEFIYNPYSGSDIEANLNIILLEFSYQSRW